MYLDGFTALRVMKTLSGSHLEGGGQILRTAVALSSLLQFPLRVTDIRGGRPTPGLKSQHLSSILWLAQACEAGTVGAAKKSTDLQYRPSGRLVDFWKEHKRNGEPVRVVEIDIGTPGSVALLLQAIVPYVLFTGCRPADGNNSMAIHLSIKGGTNVDFSPSVDYLEHVLFPILNEKVMPRGLKPFKIVTDQRCWGSTRRGNLGLATVEVPLLPWGSKLPGFNLINRGDVIKISFILVVPPGEVARAKDSVHTTLTEVWGPRGATVETTKAEEGIPKRYYLLLVAHTAQGFRLGRDILYNRKSHESSIDSRLSVELYMVRACGRMLAAELDHGGCVDEFLQDQLVVFQTLANGESIVDGGDRKESLHTETARWVAGEVTGAIFSQERLQAAKGIGLTAGTCGAAGGSSLEDKFASLRM